MFLLYAFGVKFYCEKNKADNWLEPLKHRLLVHWLQEKIEYWFQNREKMDEPLSIMILIVRKGAKTTIVSEAGSAYLHLRDPNLCTYLDSYDLGLSSAFLGVIQKVLGGSATHAWFSALYGNWKPLRAEDRPWNALGCVHTARRDLEKKDPSFECVSVVTGTTGSHPDHIAEDDPVVQEKLTEDKNWLRRVDTHQGALAPAAQQNALHILAMTTYDVADPAIKGMRMGKVKEFAPTGQKPNTRHFVEDPINGKWHVFFMPALDANGQPNFPKTWSLARIKKYEIENPLFAASQLHLNPQEGRHQIITMEKVEPLFLFQKDLPSEMRYSVHLDLAFKTEERRQRGDFNVIAVAGHAAMTGKPYILEIQRSNKWTPEDFIEQIAMLLSRYRDRGKRPFVLTDEIESSGHQGSFERWMRSELRGMGVQMPPFHGIDNRGVKKDTRIQVAAGYWRTGMIGLVREAPNIEDLVNEMVYYPYEHDDAADACAAVYDEAVFRGARTWMTGRRPAVQDTRPYDDLLKGRPGEWSDAELDFVLDRQEKIRAAGGDPYAAGAPDEDDHPAWENWR
jgi:predicted phage terminase large subunit-like protein